MSLRLAAVAEAVGGHVVGDPDREVRAIDTLEAAGEDDLSFLTHARYRSRAEGCRARALLVGPDVELPGKDLVVADDPALALARVIALFHPRRRRPAGLHPTAVIEEGAAVDATASVGAYAVVGAGSRVGPGAEIHPGVIIGRDCRIGTGATLHAHTVLYDGTEVGDNTIVHAGAVLGADGFGYASHGGVHHKVPQVGRVVIGDDVEIGANSAIDRATLGETRVGDGTKIDNLVQVGHNVQLGKGCILCGQAGIAGSARLGNYVVLGGQAGSAGHLEIGDGVQVAAKSAVLQGVEAGRKVAGIPAVDLRQWRRQVIAAARGRDQDRRLDALERAVEALEAAAEEE
ncbi:MAG: UDP-3-O-(3-hydroxymyristoyl)glucosamine N-acyltransferase [Acidobacteria bacterium]|nr:UDP-3-O-(3-hydroxymyristoyl)glucosamine N-acyltransferase [Acidobacteriota bacterium]